MPTLLPPPWTKTPLPQLRILQEPSNWSPHIRHDPSSIHSFLCIQNDLYKTHMTPPSLLLLEWLKTLYDSPWDPPWFSLTFLSSLFLYQKTSFPIPCLSFIPQKLPASSCHRIPYQETLPSVFAWTPVLLIRNSQLKSHFFKKGSPGFLSDPCSKPACTVTSCNYRGCNS